MSTLSFSLRDLSHSSVPEIWEFCNENFGCLEKDPSALFYRNLNTIRIRDPEDEAGSLVRFSDYFERRTGQVYDMGNSPYRPEINKLLNELLGRNSAEKLGGSIDQTPMLFFVGHFLKKLSERNGDKALTLDKKDLISLYKDAEDSLHLKSEFDIFQALDFDEPMPLRIPFNVRLESDFIVLDSGVQFHSLSLSGEVAEVELARKFLMGGGGQPNLLDRLAMSALPGEVIKNLDFHPDRKEDYGLELLIHLTILSPRAAVGLCNAIAMGGKVQAIKDLAGITEINMYKFLQVIGSFVCGGRLELLLTRGPESLIERRKLKEKVSEIKSKFYAQVKLMKELCSIEDLPLRVPVKPSIRISHLERFRRRSSPPALQDIAEGEGEPTLKREEKRPSRGRAQSSP